MTPRLPRAGVLAFALVLVSLRPASAGEPGLLGRWLTERANAAVQIDRCEPDDPGRVCGTIVWLRDPLDENGLPKRDTENQSADRRDRPLIGTRILSGFVARSPDHWTGGRIYNPEDGRTYDASMRLEGADTLMVEGCVLFFCRKQVWRRAADASPPG